MGEGGLYGTVFAALHAEALLVVLGHVALTDRRAVRSIVFSARPCCDRVEK